MSLADEGAAASFSLSEDAVDRILRNVAGEEFDTMRDIEPELFAHTFQALNTAVDVAFGAVAYDSPDFDFQNELKYNNAVFSAFKTHRQQNDLFETLFKEDGTPKSFAQFRRDSQPIIGAYNSQWLQTEYSTAIIRARNAAQFRQAESVADIFPNLRWMPSTSAVPREAHRPLYGLVYPIGDPFWTSNYPGNLWGCKCGIESTSDDATGVAAGKAARKEVPPPQAGLDSNPARTAAIFSHKHPYVADGYLAHKKLLPAVEKFAKKAMIQIANKHLREFAKTIPPHIGVDYKSDSLITGKIKVLRKVRDEIKYHTNDFRVINHIPDIGNMVKDWEYIGWKNVDNYPQGHAKAGESKHPEADCFMYYKTVIAGKDRYVNVKLHKNLKSEVLYCITDFAEKNIKAEIPPMVGRYKK